MNRKQMFKLMFLTVLYATLLYLVSDNGYFLAALKVFCGRTGIQ